MGSRVTRMSVGVIATAAFLVWGVPAMSAGQSDPAQLSGVWKLNVAASTNPDGPPPPARGGGSRRGGGGGGGGDSSSGGGGGGGGGEGGGGGSSGQSATTLTPLEQKHYEALKAMVFKAPPMMALEATPSDFKMLLDPATKFGFAHKTDNKKESIVTPAGPADFKVKWDGKKLRRELETKDAFKCVEEYSLSADGAQLIVTVKADSGMVRNVQTVDIKRVYDRQAR